LSEQPYEPVVTRLPEAIEEERAAELERAKAEQAAKEQEEAKSRKRLFGRRSR
jgi:hypothetical protein